MTIKKALKNAENRLIQGAVDCPEFDISQFAYDIFSLDNIGLRSLREENANDEQIKKLDEYVTRRINGEPLQYILGYWEFMGRKYFVKSGVLIPRDDTEVVVNFCIDILKNEILNDNSKNARIIDLCSGSGIIAITLKSLYPDIDVYAIEKSKTAFEILGKNALHNNVEIKALCDDVFTCCDDFEDEYFELIVSNPPYIKTEDLQKLQKEVSFEPKMALDGGEDGLIFYKSIIENWSKKLKKGGYIAFEFDDSQGKDVTKMLMDNGFCNIKILYDIQNLERAIIAKKS